MGIVQISSCIPTPKSLTVLIQPAGYNPVANAADPALTRPIVDGLLAVVVVDTVYGYQFLKASTLRAELGLDDAELWKQAMTNTIERMEVETVPLPKGEPTELLRADGLATSLLLVDEFWDPPRQSEILVAAPIAPNKLAVAQVDDRRSLKLLREMMRRDPLERRWRRFMHLLVRRNGRWEVLP